MMVFEFYSIISAKNAFLYVNAFDDWLSGTITISVYDSPFRISIVL